MVAVSVAKTTMLRLDHEYTAEKNCNALYQCDLVKDMLYKRADDVKTENKESSQREKKNRENVGSNRCRCRA